MIKPFASFLLATAASVSVWAAGPAAPAKADVAKGQASFAAICAACHSADGNSVIVDNPKLAGQHPEYVVKQLAEFKDGKRDNAIMKGMVAAITDEDANNIAAWLATQKPAPGVAKDVELVKLGEKIFRGGIQDRHVPACAGCHSPNGAGIPSLYPRVAGQFAQYSALQLTAFRDGVRKNSAQMTDVAAKMNDREIKAVAEYMSGLH